MFWFIGGAIGFVQVWVRVGGGAIGFVQVWVRVGGGASGFVQVWVRAVGGAALTFMRPERASVLARERPCGPVTPGQAVYQLTSNASKSSTE